MIAEMIFQPESDDTSPPEMKLREIMSVTVLKITFWEWVFPPWRMLAGSTSGFDWHREGSEGPNS